MHWIGTSGWNYQHWRGGLVYPAGLPARRWLEFYASVFRTVEVNSSFYSVPKPHSVAAWVESTPAGFLFALKLWRGITHYRKLRNAAALTRRFLDSAEMLPPDRRGPVLIQLPPTQGPDLPRLLEYVAEFRELAGAPGWRLAVEFRHAAWGREHAVVWPALAKAGVAICLHDMTGRGETSTPNDASFLYIRRHGTNAGRYAGSYSPEALEQDARMLQQAGRSAFVYFNNDIGGHAWFNALDLARLTASDGGR